ncbi:MAG: glucokinase [Deltaproteobacteria bacterium]|nr:glucokinase [Deltaproteobacteria bacterium]
MVKAAKKNVFVLAGDVGGTKTNLGLFVRGKKRPVLKVFETYPSTEAPNLESIVDRFLERHKVAVSSACFGVAGPVKKGRCKTTNLPWDVSAIKLKNRFKWEEACLVNDLTATAYAVPLMTKRELFTLNPVRAPKRETLGLVAPGTGLGMALMVWNDGRHVPVPSEGGHSSFAPNSKDEAALWQYLHARVGHVSAERVLSGPGLFVIYCWLKFTGQAKEPKWLAEKINDGEPSRVISEAALVKGEPICVKALELFVSIFGAAAGNLALTGLARGGVYLGGGIAPKILPKLKGGLFMRAFVNKGRFTGLLSRIPVHVILNDRAALLGAAACALRREQNMTIC